MLKEVAARIGCVTAVGICEIICLYWLGTSADFTSPCLYMYSCRVILCLSLDEECAFEPNLLTAPHHASACILDHSLNIRARPLSDETMLQNMLQEGTWCSLNANRISAHGTVS